MYNIVVCKQHDRVSSRQAVSSVQRTIDRARSFCPSAELHHPVLQGQEARSVRSYWTSDPAEVDKVMLRIRPDTRPVVVVAEAARVPARLAGDNMLPKLQTGRLLPYQQLLALSIADGARLAGSQVHPMGHGRYLGARGSGVERRMADREQTPRQGTAGELEAGGRGWPGGIGWLGIQEREPDHEGLGKVAAGRGPANAGEASAAGRGVAGGTADRIQVQEVRSRLHCQLIHMWKGNSVHCC